MHLVASPRDDGARAHGARSPRLVGLLGTLALMAAMPASAAASHWRPPARVSSRTSFSQTGPALAVAADGRAVIAWQRYSPPDQEIEVSSRAAAEGSFGRPRVLDRVARPATFLGPALASDGSGAAMAGWVPFTPVIPSGPGTPAPARALRVSVLAAHGGDPAPPLEPVAAPSLQDVSLGLDGHGDALVLFAAAEQELLGAPTAVTAISRSADSTWSAPVTLGAPGSSQPTLAINRRGQALAAWISPEGGVQIASYTRATGWGPATTISALGAAARLPSVALGPDGRALVAWLEAGVVVRVRRPDGSWEGATSLAPAGGLDRFFLTAPRAAIDPRGDAAVVWRRRSGGRFVLEVARRPANGRWRAAAAFGAVGSVGAPAIVMGRRGGVVVAWAARAAGGGSAIVASSAAGAGGRWEPPERVSERGRTAVRATLGIDAAGRVTAAWLSLPSGPHARRRRTYVAAAQMADRLS